MPIDMAPPPPPARTARKATTPRAKAVAQNPDGHKSPDASVSPMFHARRQGLAGLAQVAQMGCLAFGLKADAAAIGMHSGPLLTEVAKLAEAQPAIARWVDPLIVAGPYAALVGAAIPLIAQLAANHRMGAMTNLGAVPPEVLEARMDAEMMRAEMEAMRERAAMMQEADATRREMAALMEQQQREMANA